MARLPAKVYMIVHERTGIEVALRLDKSTMTFQATFGGETIRDKDGSVVVERVLSMIEEEYMLDWIPALKVEVQSFYREAREDSRATSALQLLVERFHYAQGESRLVRLAWEDYEVRNFGALERFNPKGYGPRRWFERDDPPPPPFTLPHVEQPHEREYVYYLPYTELAWEGLRAIVDRTALLRGQLEDILAGKTAQRWLEQVGTRQRTVLLLEGESDDEAD